MSSFSMNGSPTWTLGRSGWSRLNGPGGQDGGAADAVVARGRAEEDDLAADTGGAGEMQVLVAQHADAQGIDERVAEVGRVELDLALTLGRPRQLP